jgi:3-dehydroquinate synthase
MKFNVNNTKFNDNVNYNNILSIKSYNKIYDVDFNVDNIGTIINNICDIGDFIIIDKNIHDLYNKDIKINTDNYYYIFDAIEDTKNIETVLHVIDILYRLKFNKKNKIITIGGGITQDISGFIASIYKRGLKWVYIPTTLLSMTDSCIGGKVGINRNSKNLLALFVSPDKVILSINFLNTLKEDDIISGLGESLKLCLIGGNEMYSLFKSNMNDKNYSNIIKISMNVKKLIIEKDELEKDERKVLNYGHTFGHALESATNYFIPHGISVLFGMLLINTLFYNDKYNEINEYILELIPKKYKNKNIKLSYKAFLEHILNDKKNNGNEICFILLEDIGKSIFMYKKMEFIEKNLKVLFDRLFIDTDNIDNND